MRDLFGWISSIGLFVGWWRVDTVCSPKAGEFIGASIMKTLFKKAVVAACLLVPVLANAASATQYNPVDTYTFKIKDGRLGDLTANYSWSDLQLKGDHASTFFDAQSLGWSLALNGVVLNTGSFTDSASINSGKGALSFNDLGAGAYTLTFGGSWGPVSVGRDLEVKGPKVSLTGESLHTFKAPAAPVPEPETYAMLFAGLGLMGTIIRRRQS